MGMTGEIQIVTIIRCNVIQLRRMNQYDFEPADPFLHYGDRLFGKIVMNPLVNLIKWTRNMQVLFM